MTNILLKSRQELHHGQQEYRCHDDGASIATNGGQRYRQRQDTVKEGEGHPQGPSKLTVSQVEIPLYVLGKNAGQSAIKKTGKHDKDEQDHYPHLRMTRWQLVLHELSFYKKSNSFRNRIMPLAPDEQYTERTIA